MPDRTTRAEYQARAARARAEGWRSFNERRYWERKLDTEREIFRLGQRIDPNTEHRNFRYVMVGRRVVPTFRWKGVVLAGSILPRAADDAVRGTDTHHHEGVFRPGWKPRLVHAARAAA